jgi:Tol biopolymer transport system component
VFTAKTVNIHLVFLIAVLVFSGSVYAASGHAETPAQLIGFASPVDANWQIWIMDLQTRRLRQITQSPWDKKEPAWFNDGQHCIYRTANARLRILNMNTGKEKPILEKYGDLFDPAISTDGRRMAFTRLRENLLDNSDIWIAPFAGEKATRLTHIAGLQRDPSWSGNSEIIAFTSSEKGKQNICTANVASGRVTCLTNDTNSNILPDFAPDGQNIAFTSNKSGNYDIWVMNQNGQNLKKLTYAQGLDTQPVWSPDGKMILFVSNRRGNLQIWLMEADGSNQRPLTPDNLRCTDPAWIYSK